MYSKYCIVTFLILSMMGVRIYAQQVPVRKNNSMIVTAMNRLFNEGKVDSALLYFSDSLTMAAKPGAISPFRMMQADIDNTFPGVQTTIEAIWEDVDWVIARCMFSGVHNGVAQLPHHGGLLVGVPPTHKSFSVQHIRMYKLVNGKIVARHAVRDDLAMYQQLGLLPAPVPFVPSPNARPKG